MRTLIASLALATVAVLSIPNTAMAEEPPFNPIGGQRALVVLFEQDIVRVDPCMDFDVLKAHTKPRNTATEWQAMINADLWFKRATYAKTTLQVRVLANPDTSDGWWTTPHNNVEYCRNGIRREKTDRKGNFLGDAAIVQDAAETIIPRAVAAGVITQAEVNAYHRLIVITNYHGHAGQALGWIEYKAGGAKARRWSAHVQGEHWNDERAMHVLHHEFAHQLGLRDYYGACATFAGTAQPECTGPWDPMGWAESNTMFNAYSRVRMGWIGEAEAAANTLEPLNEAPFANSTEPYSRTFTLGPVIDPTATNRVLRIPISTRPQFEGWVVECRRRYLADTTIPDEGVLIYRVDELYENPRHFAERPVIRTHPDNAALHPGERWQGMFSLFGGVPNLQIRFDADAPRTTTVTTAGGLKRTIKRPAGCRVTVSRPTIEYKPIGTSVTNPKVTVARESFIGPSSDVWVDSPMNGLSDTAQTPVQLRSGRVLAGATRLAAPVGDAPWVGRENLVRFRVRNAGTAALSDVRVSVDAIPVGPGGGCRERERITIGDYVISSIAPGQYGTGALPWVPPLAVSGAWNVRIRAHQVAGEFDAQDNEASTTTLPGVGAANRTGALSTLLPAGTSCAGGEDSPAILDVPRGWRASLTDVRIRPATGAALARATKLTVVPPRGSRPGAMARIVLGYRSDTTSPSLQPTGQWRDQPPFMLDRGEPLNAFPVLIGLRRTASLSATCANGTSTVASALATGAIAPVHADVPVTVEYVGPSGERVYDTVRTSSTGTYQSSIALPAAGAWTAQAWWQGDRNNLPASSAACSLTMAAAPVVPPAASSLSLTCPTSSPAPVAVSGALTPAHAGVPITITWTSNQLVTPLQESTTTDVNGRYADTFTPPFTGSWTAQASWSGDADHLAASSTTCTTVVLP